MMDAQGSETTTPDAPTKPGAWWRRLLPPPQHKTRWAVGVLLLVLLAAGAVVANLRSPVLSFAAPGASVHANWSDLRDAGGLAYEQRLLVWPLVAYGLVAGVGLLAVAWSYLPPKQRRWMGYLEAPALWLLAFAGFLLALTGTRWLGFFLARRSETEASLVQLDVVPYLNLAVGVLLLAGAVVALVRLLRTTGRPLRWAAWSAAAAAGGLLLAPLLPFGHWPFGGGGVVRLDEFSLAALAAQDAPAAQALGWARMMLWGALYASVAACIAWQAPRDPAPRVVTWLRHLAVGNILFVVAGGVFLVRFHDRLPDLRAGVTVDPNPFLHLALLAVGILWGFQLRSLSTSHRRPAP